MNHTRIKPSSLIGNNLHFTAIRARVPVASGSGESGRERVGDGVPTAKLLLLLLRALPGHRKNNKKSERSAMEQHNRPPHGFHEHDNQSAEKTKQRRCQLVGFVLITQGKQLKLYMLPRWRLHVNMLESTTLSESGLCHGLLTSPPVKHTLKTRRGIGVF